MLTKKLTLSANEIKGRLCESGSNIEACLVTFGIIIPAGSFVISGGIVLVGNTLYWLEYQGTCKDGLILKGLDQLKPAADRNKSKEHSGRMTSGHLQNVSTAGRISSS